MPDYIFLHFFDHEVVELYDLNRRLPRIYREFAWATKVAYLCAREAVLLPQGFYFESKPARKVLSDARAALESGDLWFARSENDADDFIGNKREQYKENPGRYPAYFRQSAAQSIRALNARRVDRLYSSGSSIRRAWLDQVDTDGSALDQLTSSRHLGIFGRSARRRHLRRLPEVLGKTAFIWPFVRPRLPFVDLETNEQEKIKALITRAYVESYLEEYNASICVEFTFGSLDCSIGKSSGRLVSLAGVRKVLRYCGLDRLMEALTWEDLIGLRDEIVYPRFRRFVILGSKDPEGVAEALRVTGFRFSALAPDGLSKGRARRDAFVGRVETVVSMLERFQSAAVLLDPKGGVMRARSADVGIICVVADEMNAIVRFLSSISECVEKEGVHQRRFFHEARMPATNGGLHRVVVTRALEQGNRSIMPAYQAMMEEYCPDVVVLLGVGGGIHKDAHAGDVVIADSIIYYDKRAVTENGPKHRIVPYAIKPWLLIYLNRFFDRYGDVAVLKAAEGSPAASFKLLLGPLGSGEAVIKYRDAEERRWLQTVNDKTLVLETEAGGLAQRFYEDELRTSGRAEGFLVLRGLSDHADQDKDDRWRAASTMNAMISLQELLSSIPVGFGTR